MPQMLLQPKQKSTTFYAVYYRGKPGHEDIVEGIQNPMCADINEANRSVEAAKKWWNVEKKIIHKDGKEEIQTTIHDRVDVWIDTYKDGKLVHSGEPGWAPDKPPAPPPMLVDKVPLSKEADHAESYDG